MEEQEEKTPPGGEEAPPTEGAAVEAPAEPQPAAEASPELAAAEPPAPDPRLAEAVATLEALLYASGKPASEERLAEAAELPPELVKAGLAELETSVNAEGRGIRLERVAGGVRIVSRPDFDYPIRRLLGIDGKSKLSMAALETLSIIAYRQPITAPEVAELRGVSSASSIRTLLDRKLITTAGRKAVVGTPFLYKTTKEFLVHFGLVELNELPKPEELEALYGVEAVPPPEATQTELFAPSEVEEPAAATPETADAPGVHEVPEEVPEVPETAPGKEPD